MVRFLPDPQGNRMCPLPCYRRDRAWWREVGWGSLTKPAGRTSQPTWLPTPTDVVALTAFAAAYFGFMAPRTGGAY